MMAATATSMAVIALVSGGGFLIYLTGAHPPLPLLGGLPPAARSACSAATCWRSASAARPCNACSR